MLVVLRAKGVRQVGRKGTGMVTLIRETETNPVKHATNTPTCCSWDDAQKDVVVQTASREIHSEAAII